MASPELLEKFLKDGLPANPLQAESLATYDPKATRSKLIGIFKFSLTTSVPSEENAKTLAEPDAIDLNVKGKFPLNSFAGCKMSWIVGLEMQSSKPTILFSTTETEPLGGDYQSEFRVGGKVASLKKWLALAQRHLSDSACNFGKINKPLIGKHQQLLWGGLKASHNSSRAAKIYGWSPVVIGPRSLTNLGTLKPETSSARMATSAGDAGAGNPEPLGRIGKIFADNLWGLL